MYFIYLFTYLPILARFVIATDLFSIPQRLARSRISARRAIQRYPRACLALVAEKVCRRREEFVGYEKNLSETKRVLSDTRPCGLRH